MDGHDVTELDAQINPEDAARRLRREDTIEEYDATSNTDSSDSDFEPDGAGDDPPQAIVVRDKLRTTEELDKAKLHDDAQPFAQSKHSGREKDGKEQGRKARRTTKTSGWPEGRDPPNVGDDVLVRMGNMGAQSIDKAIGDAAIARDEKPVVIGGAGMRVYQGSDWERKIFKVVLREEVEKRDGSM